MRYLPYVIGFVAAFLLFSPIRIGGPWLAPLLGVLLVAAFLLGMIALLINQALPRNVRLTPIDPQALDASMNQRLNDLESAGFELAGPAYQVGCSPPAVLVPLFHRQHACYATVYRTGTQPPKVSHDIVSVLDPVGGLTTTPAREAGTFPTSDGVFVQCIETNDMRELLQAHLQAMAWLQQQQVRIKPAGIDTFEQDFRDSMNRQRDRFLKNPLHVTAVALVRTIRKRTPHLGPIAQQAAARAMIARLAALGAARPMS
jgi:hypothetical protein